MPSKLIMVSHHQEKRTLWVARAATRIFFAAILLHAIHSTNAASSASFCDTQPGWKTVWADEFDGSALNTSNWVIATGPGGSYGRDAFLVSDNVYVSNGTLVLRSMKNDQGHNFTSGAVSSQNKQSFTFGRCCVRAKLPGAPGEAQGIWPAHWMMPNDNSCWPDHGEVDILEMINGDGNAHGTYHWDRNFPSRNCTGQSGNTAVSGQLPVSNWHTEFHEYAVEWGKDYVHFLVDSKVYVNITSTSKGEPGGSHPEFEEWPVYVILNTAVGGPWPGPPSPKTRFPAYHYIDYVRVAQRQP